MTDAHRHPIQKPLDLDALVALTGARVAGAGRSRALSITGVGSLDWAGPSELAFVERAPRDPGEAAALGDVDAGACIVPPTVDALLPPNVVALVCGSPLTAYLAVARALFPSASRPVATFGAGVASGAAVHAEARLEPDVSIEPGAVVGPGAEIGRGAVICANAVIGAGTRIGRDTAIGSGAVVTNALVGDRVVIQSGASIGHGGLASDDAADAAAAPSLGRVIIQDDAEIGANVAVARGRRRDTVIGEGARLDALTRVAADVVVGRRCLVYADVALAEGADIGDHVICGLAGDSRRGPFKDAKP